MRRIRDAKVVRITVNLGDTEHELDTNMTLMDLYETVRDNALGEWSSIVVTLVPKEGEDDNISAQ
jgi:sulfur carrier protein ThiS